MEDTEKVQQRKRISVLWTNIRSYLEMARREETTYEVFEYLRPSIYEFMTEVDICVQRIQLSGLSDEKQLQDEKLLKHCEFLRELHQLELRHSRSIPDTPSSLPSGRRMSSFTVKPPQVQIVGPTFDGLNIQSNPMAFRVFLSRFNNCVAGMANDAERLNFLKCSLSGQPLLLIDHLAIHDENYEVAINILKNEYLDEDEIVDCIFQDILDFSGGRDQSYTTLTNFVAETASRLTELEGSFGCIFSDDNGAGARLMAKIVFSKLPKEIKGELVQIAGKRFPPLSAVLRNTKEAVKRQLIKSTSPPFNTVRDSPRRVSSQPKPGPSRRDPSSHVYSACHSQDEGSSFLPPILCVTFGMKDKQISFNCLVDTGSCRTYISGEMLKAIQPSAIHGQVREMKLSTILGERSRSFTEVTLEARVGPQCPFSLPVLVHKEVDVSIHIRDLDVLLNEFQHIGCALAAQFNRGTGFVPIRGILGLDFINQMTSLQLVPCLQGQAFLTPAGLVPFGEVRQFLPSKSSTDENGESLAFSSVLAETPQVTPSLMCFVLETHNTYEDPLSDFFPDSVVQRGIEKMFDMESLGVQEADISEYDEQKIDWFRRSIQFRDDKYYIQLPWVDDKLSRVPSNHAVALRTLEHVARRLEKKHLYQDYVRVFREQEQEGIIEEIFVTPDRFHEYVWIPHRPVLKSDPTSTTKIRPVFNCSLKIGDAPSLNEATYQGINLTGNLLDLLIKFRTNSHVVLADIRKAFLMIRLQLESDRNKFCFFLKDGGHLRCFRYNTILFGFASSPFILNYILRHHAARFPPDDCRQLMENNFYVDNLIITGGDPAELCRLYELIRERLQQGGFELQSCNSDHKYIRDRMKEQDTLSKHSSDWEKVLGYRYHPHSDLLCVTPVDCNPEAVTKRQILGEVARVYDPLSLCLPVSIRGRVLLSQLWKCGYDWDTPVSQDHLSPWRKLSADLSELETISFPRKALDEGKAGELFLFCDASPEAYGFAAYTVQDHKASLVFAKAKVAPLKKKSLPTMELMAVFLALKCLHIILTSLGRFSPSQIHVATDSQVVLSWLISGTVISKNIFARNRLKDIQRMSIELQSALGFLPSFRYVPTRENPADLITRGLTLRKFKEHLNFWCQGPAWLSSGIMPWASQELPCLSLPCQEIARSSWSAVALSEEVSSTVLPLERYSSFARLLRVTSLVFRFIYRTRKMDGDCEKRAAVVLMKTMQQQVYAEELAFLLGPAIRTVPPLVRRLDLFIDGDGLIRSGGRIGGAIYFRSEVKHPILLAKHHPVTKLVIMDAHSWCQHLGVAPTLAEVRRRGYWIPQGRQAVKTTLSSCALCRRYNARQVAPPNVASLPSPRVDLEIPFSHTGVDFTGHFWIKDGNKLTKIYLLIFTCLSIRAVHIELVPDMSVLAFFQALVRFTNLRGVPTAIYSDNAKTFVGSARLFQKLVLSHDYRQKFGSCAIKFRPIPLFSPWVGGVWERMIQTIKNCLFKVVGRGELDYFSLFTILTDIQRAINNRPLTYRTSDEREMEAVTPNMFLGPTENPGLLLDLADEGITSRAPPGRERLLRTMQVREQCLDKFRKLWYHEYLLSLRERPQGRTRVPIYNKLKVGDIVIIKSPLKPKPFWVLGIVLETFGGRDGVVRSAKIKQGCGTIRTHSLRNIFPLELGSSTNGPDQAGPSSIGDPGEDLGAALPEMEPIWLCLICNAPQGDQSMIGCDGCDNWCHFGCVGIDSPPPEREKWYCPDCAPQRRRRGRPSLLPG